MEVQSYTFQSPYPSPVQVGRADTTKQQSEKSQEESTVEAQKNTENLNDITQTREVQPDAPERLLDIYA
jgi:hypothetical protein